MRLRDIIGYAKIRVGETSQYLLQDEAQVEMVAIRAIQQCYADLGYSFKEELELYITPDEPESLLPSNVLKVRLVLVNGVELEEITYEQAAKGYNLGVNQSPNQNLIDYSPRVARPAYYFRQSLEGRYLGISPVPTSEVVVRLIYDYVPTHQPGASMEVSQPSSPIFDEILVIAVALSFLDLISTMDNARLVSESNVAQLQELASKVKVEGTMMQLQQKVMSPIETYSMLLSLTGGLRQRFKAEYEIEKRKILKNLQISVKPPMYRHPNGLLNIMTNRSRNRII